MNSGNKVIGWWLLLGVIMLYFQIILGGITRLTGSGLSITQWEIITGTIPQTWRKRPLVPIILERQLPLVPASVSLAG